MALRFQLQVSRGPSHDVCRPHIQSLERDLHISPARAIGISGASSHLSTPLSSNCNQDSFHGRSGSIDGRPRSESRSTTWTLRDGSMQVRTLGSPHRVARSPTWCSRDLAQAVIFLPSEGTTFRRPRTLYKKAIVLAPGTFSHVDAATRPVHADCWAFGDFSSFGSIRAKQRRRPPAFFA